jgi:hypothetical protein
LDPASNAFQLIAAPNPLQDTSVSALWGDGQGYLYASQGGSRQVLRINIATGEANPVLGGGWPGPAEFAEGIGTNARMRSPRGGAFVDGALYIADVVSDVIVTADSETFKMTTAAGLAPANMPDEVGTQSPSDGTGPTARIWAPAAIWGDTTNLYITDSYSVRRVNRTTRVVTTIAGNPRLLGSSDGVGMNAHFSYLKGIWGDGNALYVADSWNNLIRRITLATRQVTRLAADARFNSPDGIWGDGTYLYIADTGSYTIRRLTLATNEVITIAGVSGQSGFQDGPGPQALFHYPVQLAGDGSFLYVSDYFNNAIRRISLSNYEVTTLRIFGPGPGMPPGSIEAFLGSQGNMFVNGRFLYLTRGHAVLKMDTETGVDEVIAGSLRVLGSEDGPAAVARFQNPGGIWVDNFTVYVADTANDAIRAIDLIPPTPILSYTVDASAAFSKTTTGTGFDMTVGSARIQPDSVTSDPTYGFAIFGLRQQGVLVTEASVPASPLIRNGRIFAEVSGVVNTGIAIANPNDTPAAVSFYFTDGGGTNFGSGSFTLAANGQISAFLNEQPFNTGLLSAPSLASARTFTFSSSVPIGVIALRGFTNERSEFLITTMPVVDLAHTTSGTLVMPHFADGGGWTTVVNLINPSDNAISGTVTFVDIASSPIPYTIAARSSAQVRIPTFAVDVRTGSVQINPASGQMAPSANAVFSFRRNGTTVSMSSIAAEAAASAVRIYVEGAGTIQQASPGALETGVAIANPTAETATMALELSTDRGRRTASLDLPGNGHVALFLKEIPAFADLPETFRGVLRISTSSAGGLTATGLRGRYNERGDFLIASTPPAAESMPAEPRIFPHFVDGAGYNTQFVLFKASGVSTDTGSMLFYSRAGQSLSLRIF